VAQSTRPERVGAIDGLRGVASLMVIFVHTTFNVGAGYGIGQVQPYFYAGQMGVPLFFVISAFCLYGTYSKLTLQQPRTAVAAFWIKRSARILPLWWVWVTVYAVWHQHQLRNAAASAFFYWGFARYGPFTDVFPGGWSLFVEETFYWLFPLLFPLFRSLSRTVAGGCVAWALSLAWERYAALAGVPTGAGYISYSPVNHWYCFFLGMACFQLTRHKLWPTIATWIAKHNVVSVLAIMTLALDWTQVSNRPTALLFAGVLLIAMAPGTWLSRLMSLRPLCWFGRRCYSAYLCHFFILDYLAPKTIIPWSDALHLPPYLEIRMLVCFPAVVAATAIVAAVTFQLIEVPTMALATKASEVLGRRRVAAPIGETALGAE
jgi:peptidoglycan/LPS O-acetylase OafA/YrhL